MPRHIALSRVSLRYADKLVLHTASSGIVPALEELRLVIAQDGAVAGIGACRINIRYLNGLEADSLANQAVTLCRKIDWSCAPGMVIEAVDVAAPPAVLRMLVEMAVRDAQARVRGVPLSVLLGGSAAATSTTNQTLFWCDDGVMCERAGNYLSRGFAELKLRIGVGSVEDDLRRLARLRALAPSASLSADANGQWDIAQAKRFIAGAIPLGLTSLEQPLPKGERAGLAELRAVPIMLDEDMEDESDVDWLVATRAVPLAHLKLVKLGGLDRLMAAARRLGEAGIGVMVGQMNEGTPSTLAAAHAAIALGAGLRELYGADGIVDDPAGTLRYGDGLLHLPPGAGLGIEHAGGTEMILWEHTV